MMQILEPTSKAAAGLPLRSPETADRRPHLSADDRRWQLALRIAASRSLGRSQLLSDFLLYIVERGIQGRRGEITEQQIGVAVFGRAEDYNSNDDNIVRSYARKLRKRIDDYYLRAKAARRCYGWRSRAADIPPSSPTTSPQRRWLRSVLAAPNL